MALPQLHLTLRFVGAVEAETQQCLIDGAGRVKGEAFDFTLDTLGYWGKPKVLWLGPSAVPAAMQALAQQLETVCTACGLPAEKRDFAPHMTLLRKVRRPPRERTLPPLHWAVSEFVLVRSDTLPEGAQYTLVQRWKLG